MTDTHYTLTLADATQHQRDAADPSRNIFVSANAGSGKTRVLVDRVSRILLTGVEPDKILCLTYTKAAAREMQSRLFETLGGWSVVSEDKLQEALQALTGDTKVFDEDDLKSARELFAKALETPEGLRVQTIHAFCENLLRRFPVEAGIAPGFDVLDDAAQRRLTQACVSDLLQAASSDTNLSDSLKILAKRFSDKDLQDLFADMCHRSRQITAWREGGGLGAVADRLGVALDATPESEKRSAWEAADERVLKICRAELANSGSRNKSRGAAIASALAASDSESAFDEYCGAFFTKEGDLFKTVVWSKDCPTSMTFMGDKTGPGPEAMRMQAAKDRVTAARVLQLTRAYFHVAVPLSERFLAAKFRQRVMDFDDQIQLARGLLQDSDARDWVRYKLDGGIEHILLDEAQDTAPDQWDIIEAIAEAFEFPSPDRDPNAPKTMFAVGDEKQSIYSFQGARPELFLEKSRERLGNDGRAPRMRMSFRSTPEVLRIVDAVFYDGLGIQEAFDAENRPEPSDFSRHVANRAGPGRVEIWPPVPYPDEDLEEDPAEPVDIPASNHPAEVLALHIAEQISEWLDRGEQILDRKSGEPRAMQPSDFLILVKRRSDLFEAIIRQLKRKKVPVAGADKLTLTDATAVKDLLALGRLACLPQDDLSLAEILRSPFFDVHEDDLFDLAYDRGKKGAQASLWSRLQSSSKHAGIAKVLSVCRDMAGHETPYEFYARFLNQTSLIDGQTYLERLYGRLTLEAADSVEAFLSRALAYQRSEAPSLQNFLAQMDEDDVKLKREMQAGENQVRVMTVHGSKGLESPVVILPDTIENSAARNHRAKVLVWSDASGAPVMALSPSSGERTASLTEHVEALAARQEQEDMRLLYVAMTRAETRLVVCGYEPHKRSKSVQWHDRILAALQLPEIAASEYTAPTGTGLAYGAPSTQAAGGNPDTLAANDRVLPDWALTPPRPERRGLKRVTPSAVLGSAVLGGDAAMDAPVRSPSSMSGLGPYRRGNLIHKLLEVLPDQKPDARDGFARAFLNNQPDLSDDIRGTILREVFAVLDGPEFAHVFAEGSMPEVSLAGTAKALPGLYVNGQIDRLVVTETEVWIIDYKSNRPPPLTVDEVPDLYWGQMAAYRALAHEIYPSRSIHCALLWTDGPRLMVLPDERLNSVEFPVGHAG